MDIQEKDLDDTKEAEEAMELAKGVIELVEKKIAETEP